MNENFLEIPLSEISDDAATGVIKNHLLKEMSSDTTLASIDLDFRIKKVKEMIRAGKSLLIFDKKAEEVIVISKSDYLEFRKQQEKQAPIWHGAQVPDESELPF